MLQNPLILGVTGGIASGKSLVAEQFRQLGAWRLDADRAGHEVLREPAVIAALRARWGDRILAPSGVPKTDCDKSPEIDRPAVGRIVFASPPAGPPELAFLEAVTHPRITRKLEALIAEANDARPRPAALVLDAAVMFRAGWRRFCDWLVFVEAPRELRQQRAASRGWSAAEFAARETAQETVEWKRWQADIMIKNDASPEQSFAQTRAFWRALRIPCDNRTD